MNITVIGCGYVGLVSGTCLAALGHHIIAVDVDKARVESLRQGKVPIYEPGLSELIQAEVKSGRLSFTTDTAAAVAASETIFIAVGTPPRPARRLRYDHAFCRGKNRRRCCQRP